MKVSGIVRKLDKLGRIVIPIEMRNIMGVSEGDSLEMIQTDSGVIVRKYNEGCIFCGGKSKENVLVEYRGIKVCRKCRAGVSRALSV